MGVPATEHPHHHRSTTKQTNKPFKARHATKSDLKERSKGKVERLEKSSRKTPNQHFMSKLDRRNQAKQKRLNHSARQEEEASVFSGRDGAPRIVAIVPLCQDVETSAILNRLNESVGVELDGTEKKGAGVDIARFKQKVRYLTPARELFQTLDACQVADYVLFVLSAEEEVDQLGEQMLRCIESQGISTVITGTHNLDRIEPAKRRPDVLKSLKSFITHFFAAQEKVHDLSNRQDCCNVMRSLCSTSPKGIKWRDDRSWMAVEDVQWQDSQCVVSGVVRGKNLKADRLVHVGDWGDFQVESIAAAVLSPRKMRSKAEAMTIDGPEAGQTLDQPTADLDDLAELAPEDTMMEDVGTIPPASLAPSERRHVLLDDHHYFDEDLETEAISAPRRLPKGTSKYQAAWFLGDVSDSGSDFEDVEDEGDDINMEFQSAPGPEDGHFDQNGPEPTEAGAPSEYPFSEAFDDRAPEEEAGELAAYRSARREEGEDDLEFPDEVELHPHVSAKERLARYRGLKSLRTSQWETEEDVPFQPEDWSRLLEIADHKSAKTRVLKESLVGGVKAGTRVDIHLRIPYERVSELRSSPQPTTVFSLLRHEHKQTVINTSITLSSEYPSPIKSKTEVVLQCGPRRLRIRPVFSQPGNTKNNVHKFDRYLHPGHTTAASFIGPLGWGSIPCLYFLAPVSTKPADAVEDLADAMVNSAPSAPMPSLELIATGTLLPPSTSRVIAKRIILTGHPFKIHKKLVTIRYMFFNNEDVEYFKSLPLWTKRGRSGFVKETLGTHGYFKATFDGKINPMDSVGVSLYKRVWPRPATSWRPGEVDLAVDAADDNMIL